MTDFALCAALIGYFEGFTATAAWDVNAYRIGFGSDTEGPECVKVTHGMTTTRTRALENLKARLGAFERTARDQVGPEFDKLHANAQAALVSFAYNYGRLTSTVHVRANRGDMPGLARAIAARGTDNSGVNSKRRFAEASFVASTEV